ncbi:tetratricopeptide repeat protein [Adhaeretor mobilis]|uniref:Beta-lactamase HcpD n=1 Tax=Adhaeretor mobilis TaxID=1930276 RepID=A0A517N1M2_9BACT|nr:tetratricopeptide repeat protein [Adhaeretor mobilis]QDT01031.1 Putative beta-lactamase HcpD precursor [Adhaeretor mobilis]
MSSFLTRFVLVVGLMLSGCSKKTERNATDSTSTVEVEKDEALPSKVDEVDVEPQKDKEDINAVANFEAGIAAYQANDLPLAYEEFLAASKKGHADSQFNLGLMYEQGIGVGKDEKKAVVWYGKSAAQGNAAAQFNLGVLYENGRGAKVNFAKANKWYRYASVQGDGLAIGNLGMLYVRGDGVTENKVAGVALLLMSAAADQSPENHARRNITATRGLTADMIASAQALSEELSSAKNLLEPLDQYLSESENRAKKQ